MKTGKFTTEQKAESREQREQGRPFLKKRLPLLCLLVSALCSASYADLSISASLDRQQVSLNEQATLNVVISGSFSNLPPPQLPELPNFQVTNAGSSQNYSWVNGKTSASVTSRFMLSPKEVGKFTIPSIRVTADGQVAETQPLPLEVVRGSPNAAPVPQSADSPVPAQQAPGLFITTSVDKPSAYVGEPITLSFRLYRRVAILSQPQYQPPNTTGFWSEDLPPQNNYRGSAKGVPYEVTEVKTALFPTTSGKATIGPAQLRVAIQNVSNDVFASLFSGGEQKVLQTDPIAITVKPLPEPRPSGFKGAVGQFELSGSLDKTTTSVGQPITLTVTISGAGNIKSLPDLTLPAMTNVRTFDTTAATNIEKKDYRVQGSKVFKSILVPQVSGELRIPPVSFVYFDPHAHAYKTLLSKSFALNVNPAPAGSSVPTFAPAGSSPAPTPNVQVLGEDIRYIKTPSALTSQGTPLYQNKAVLGLNGLAFLVLLGTGFFTLYQRIFLSDPRQMRFRSAAAIATKKLKEPKNASTLGDILRGYLAAKLGLHEIGLSLQETLAQLTTINMKPDLIQKIRDLWETLDLYQFAPAQVKPEDLEKAAGELEKLMAELEKEISWKE